MDIKNLKKLREIKHYIIKEGIGNNLILEDIKKQEEEILDNTSATGGVSSGGMGSVVSAQPSGLAGETIGPNWASQGGTTGSGDVSVPYNPSGSNRVFQKIPMGRNHGPRTGKKSRIKKSDIENLKKLVKNRKERKDDIEPENKNRKKKVMDFNDFLKQNATKPKV